MKMISRKRFRKHIALFLLLVLFVPFIPLVSVSADPLPVQVPDFPYGVNVYHSTNTGSFALWQVHGSNYISYVQTYSNVFGDGYVFPVVFRSGLSWTGYYYYINYEKIIDTWDIYGNHIDGFPGTKNIRIPRPNETTTDSDVYATLVYCTTDIYYGNGYGDDDVYAYQNFIVPDYADPTPTPTPEPEIDKKFPTFINAYYDNRSGDFRYINFYLVVNRLYDEANTRYQYDVYAVTERRFLNIQNKWEIKFLPKYDSYDFINNTFTARFLNVAPDGNWDGTFGSFSFTSSNYKTESDIYDLKGKVSSNAGGKLKETSERNYELSIPYDSSLNYEATAIYIINTDGSTTRLDGDGGDTPVGTPTPTPRPTVIPQPSTSPTPTDPPETGTDDNYTGLFGWLKRIRDAILNIPKKIVKGLVDALKYIFIPDINKVKEVFNTVKNKFGIQHPPKFTVDPNELFRPNNVIWKFHPISLNGEETETTDITLINFEMVDEWLDSSAGMVITRILQAMFGITMFAYAIYIFTKHIASINYTDARTLMHLDDSNSSSKGGWWIKDD